MTDQELVVAAAEAVGIKGYNVTDSGILWADELPGNLSGAWDPLEDDGDSFRLAMDLGFVVYPCARTSSGQACIAAGTASDGRLSEVTGYRDTYSGARRATLLAAAEWGKRNGNRR